MLELLLEQSPIATKIDDHKTHLTNYYIRIFYNLIG